MKLYITLFILSLVAYGTRAQVFDAIIAADGSGTYTSVKSAIDRVRPKPSGRYLFYIKPGKYEEKVSILRNNVSLIGADVDEVIISWDDYSGDPEGHSTSTSYTVLIEGNGFHAENITFENTAGNVSQAVAVSTTGSQQSFRNCRFVGFQDTYYAKQGMQYFTDCYIEGATDFIFGESTAVFDNCRIQCVKGGQYVTAPADTKLITQIDGENFYHGLLFLNCEIAANADVAANAYYLGRPWQPNSSSVFIECSMGAHIKPAGWSDWNNDNHLSATFAEYQNRNLTSELIDVSNRVSWSQQLSSERAEYYKELDYYLNGWDPVAPMEKPDIPAGLQASVNESTLLELSWAEVTGAKGYVVYKNDFFEGFIDTNVYEDAEGKNGDTYQVGAVTELGVIGGLSELFTVDGFSVLGLEQPFNYKIQNEKLYAPKNLNFTVYSIHGQRLVDHRSNELSLSTLGQGLYIIHMEDDLGRVRIARVAL